MATTYFDKITTGLSFNGNFNDWSKYKRSVIVESGVTMQQSVIKFGSYSASFPGTAMLAVDDIEWSGYSGDFCIEFWLNATKTSSNDLALIFGQVANDSLGWGLYLEKATDTIQLLSATTGTWAGVSASFTTWGAWTHVAIVRQGNLTKIFLNGSQISAGTFTFPQVTSLLQVGGNRHTTSPQFMAGYISDLRMIRGAYIYTTNPPTSATFDENNDIDYASAVLALHADGADGSTTITDVSSYNRTSSLFGLIALSTDQAVSGTTSLKFDGQGSYMKFDNFPVDSKQTFQLNVYPTENGKTLFSQSDGGTYERRLVHNSNGSLSFFSSTNQWTTTATVPLNQWTNVIIQLNGTECEIFINLQRVSTTKTVNSLSCIIRASGPQAAISANFSSGCLSYYRGGGRYAKFIVFEVTATETFSIQMWASFDTYIYLTSGIGPGAAVIASNDDYNGPNSQINVTLSPGFYTLEATSYGGSSVGQTFTVNILANNIAVYNPPASEFFVGTDASRADNTKDLVGYLDDFIVYNGISKYSLSFATPTSLYQGYSTRSVVINVKDSVNARNIQGAQVTVVYSQSAMSTGTTDASGNVTLSVPTDYPWTVTAAKNGYTSSSAYIEYQTSTVSLSMRLADSFSKAEARYKAYNPVIALVNDSNDATNTISNKGSVGGYMTLDTNRVRKQNDSGSLEAGVPYLYYHTGGYVSDFDYSGYSVSTEAVGDNRLVLNATSTGATWSIWVKPISTISDYTEYTYAANTHSYPNGCLIGEDWTGDGSNAIHCLHIGTNFVHVSAWYSYNHVIFRNAVSLSGWNHIVITMDASSNFTFYLNGVKQRTVNAAMGTRSRWFANSFGGYQTYDGNYSGSFTEFMCIARALSDTEVKALYQRQYYTLEGSAYLDQDNNVIPCIVRVYDKATGALVSDTVTDESGKWSIFVSQQKQYDVVCSPINQDDLTLPAQIISGVIPL